MIYLNLSTSRFSCFSVRHQKCNTSTGPVKILRVSKLPHVSHSVAFQ